MAELGTAYYPVDIPVCLAVILVLPAGMLTHSTTLCKPRDDLNCYSPQARK